MEKLLAKLFGMKKPEDPAAAWYFIFIRAAELDKEAREQLKDDGLDESAFQIETTLRKAIMNKPTMYDLNGGRMQTLKQILTLKPIDMTYLSPDN